MMKNILFILILFCVAPRIYGQAYDKVKVPLVKESEKVDSLLNQIITNNKIGTTIHSKSYFFDIDIRPSVDVEGIGVTVFSNEFPIIDLPGFGWYKNGKRIWMYHDNITYFIHKGIIVFVNGNVSYLKLFKKTNRSKSFLFKKQPLRYTSFPTHKYIFFAIYQYQKGHIIPVLVSPD